MKKLLIQANCGAGQYIRHIEAAAPTRNGISDVTGVAYSGGVIRQYWSEYPIVIDLNGMNLAQQIPLMYNHQNEPDKRLGQVIATIKGNAIEVKGGVDTGTEKGRFIAEAGKQFNWQLSIGAEVQAAVKIEAGEEGESVNGRTIKGTFIKVTRSVLREISVVAIGADPETTLSIAASLHIGGMNQEMPAANIEAARNEVARQQAIKAICAEYPSIAESAIAGSWTIEMAAKAVETLEKMAAGNGLASKSNVSIYTPTEPEITKKSLEAALCMKLNLPDIEKRYKESDLEAAEKMRYGITLKNLMIQCCNLENKAVGMAFDDSTIAAAFSTQALPSILSNVANMKALQSFTSARPIATRLCREGNISNFKLSERYRLTDVGDLQKVQKNGEIQHGGLMEESALNQLETYGKIFVLDRKTIYNDQLGDFLRIPEAMGQRAARKLDQVFAERLLANPTFTDGKPLFCADHKNYMTGSGSALTLESLADARNKFLVQTDADGQPINIRPRFLLVPAALETLAESLTLSAQLTGNNHDMNELIPALNVISIYRLEVIGSPYLQNALFQNNSATGWYLFGDSSFVDTFEIGYLNGQTAPTVTTGAVNFNTLGMAFRVVYDFGIREQSFQGMLFSTGTEE